MTRDRKVDGHMVPPVGYLRLMFEGTAEGHIGLRPGGQVDDPEDKPNAVRNPRKSNVVIASDGYSIPVALSTVARPRKWPTKTPSHDSVVPVKGKYTVSSDDTSRFHRAGFWSRSRWWVYYGWHFDRAQPYGVTHWQSRGGREAYRMALAL